MVDRTKEFLRLTSEALVTAPVKPPSTTLERKPQTQAGPLDKRERTRQAILFTEKAGEVSRGIQACSVLLGRLTTLARAQTLFNDPQDELSLLSIKVKNEISSLKGKLSDLEDWLKKNDVGGGKDAKLHSEQIVKAMEFKLQDSGKQFVRVLESRKSALRAQTQRKRMFGDDEDEDGIGRPMPQSAFAVAQDEESGLLSNGSNSMITTASMVPFQQQRQLIPDNQYLRSRVDAIHTVESHIAELGQVMSTLAVMIHEQDNLVNEMSENVERSQLDVRAGFVQLEKYYNSIRGNKKLVSRLFGVFVAFLFFFLFFLA